MRTRSNKVEQTNPTLRAGWLVIGFLALALGIIGIPLPLLPTTPFILLAAFAFARSSERLHRWLLEHDTFGTMIENWQRHGAISTRAKALSVVSMAVLFVVAILSGIAAYVVAIHGLVLGLSAAYILTRPSPPRG